MDALDDAVLPAIEFKKIAENALAQLNSEFPFGVWLLQPQKKNGLDTIVLCSEPFIEKVKAKIATNDVFTWLKSVAEQSTSFKTPVIINDTKKDKTFAELKKAKVRAYIAVPVYDPKGGLFGT